MLISELFALIFMILYQNNFLFIFYLFPYKFIHYIFYETIIYVLQLICCDFVFVLQNLND